MTDAASWPEHDEIVAALRDGALEHALALLANALHDERDERRRQTLLLARGQLRSAMGEYAAALVDLDAALDLGRESAQLGAVLLARAEAAAELGDVQAALRGSQHAADLLANHPAEAAARHQLGRLEREHGDLGVAIAQLELARDRAVDNPELRAEATLDLAIARRVAGDLETARDALEQLLAAASDDAWRGRLLAQLGVTHAWSGAWETALDAYTRALPLVTDATELARLRYNRAAVLRELGQLAAARAELAEGADSELDDLNLCFDIQLLTGIVEREAGDLPAALEALQAATTLTEGDERQGRARLELGVTLAATGLFGLAVDEFSAAIALCRDPADLTRAHRYRGTARHELGLTGLALDDFTRAVTLTSDPDERARGELTRAALLVSLGDGDGAWAALGAALRDGTEPETVAQARFQHGSLAADRGEVEVALSDLREAAEAAHAAGDRQLETQAQLNLGVALNAADRVDEAAEAFQHAAALAGGGPLAQLAWHNLARLHVAADQPQAAIEAFERAATAAEDDRNARADAFLARGNALVRWGRYVEADADFTRVLALQPTDALQAQARYSRGLTRSMLGQLERAREDLTITIAGARDRDQRAQALLDRGLVALAAGDFDGAEHDLAEAAQTFRRRANRAVAHVHLAVIQAQQGRCDDSAAQLQLAFELDRAGDALELARHEPRLRLCEDAPGFPLALVTRDE